MDPHVSGRTARGRVARAAFALFLTLALLCALPAAGSAGGVGKWTDLTGATGTNLTQVGLQVTPDGLLHVVWTGRSATAGKDDLLHRVVKAGGAVGARQTVEAAWSALNDPAIVYNPASGELAIAFSGIRGASAGDPYQRMTLSTSLDGGASWALSPALIDPPSSTSWASAVAAIRAGGELYETWYGSSGVWVHRGVSPDSPAFDYQSGLGSFGYHSNFGLEKGGALWLVWASNATGNSGLYAQMVDQTSGAPAGPLIKLPSSTTKWSGAQRFSMTLSRVPVVGRAKGNGVFVAYPSGYPTTGKVRLWRITAAKRTSMLIASSASTKDETAIAAAPDGRIWVVWSERTGGRPKVVVRRSNATVTSFGPAKAYTVPSGYASVWHLAAAARGGKLDVMAHVGGGSKADATLHIQFKPPT
jgi:hypothetical protein